MVISANADHLMVISKDATSTSANYISDHQLERVQEVNIAKELLRELGLQHFRGDEIKKRKKDEKERLEQGKATFFENVTRSKKN